MARKGCDEERLADVSSDRIERQESCGVVRKSLQILRKKNKECTRAVHQFIWIEQYNFRTTIFKVTIRLPERSKEKFEAGLPKLENRCHFIDSRVYIYVHGMR